jgi:hypothetical protein
MNTFKICFGINVFIGVFLFICILCLRTTIKEHRVVQDALLDEHEELVKIQDEILAWIN